LWPIVPFWTSLVLTSVQVRSGKLAGYGRIGADYVGGFSYQGGWIDIERCFEPFVMLVLVGTSVSLDCLRAFGRLLVTWLWMRGQGGPAGNFILRALIPEGAPTERMCGPCFGIATVAL
jgi:hypothetical protein